MSSEWFQLALPAEQDFCIRRQQLGLLELAPHQPERVATLCGQLLWMAAINEQFRSWAVGRIAQLEQAAMLRPVQVKVCEVDPTELW